MRSKKLFCTIPGGLWHTLEWTRAWRCSVFFFCLQAGHLPRARRFAVTARNSRNVALIYLNFWVNLHRNNVGQVTERLRSVSHTPGMSSKSLASRKTRTGGIIWSNQWRCRVVFSPHPSYWLVTPGRTPFPAIANPRVAIREESCLGLLIPL